MEGALVTCTVAKKTYSHLPASPHLTRKRRAGSQCDTAAHNAVCTKHIQFRVADVERSAFAAAVPCGFAEQLGHHAFQITTLGDYVAVASMGTGDIIVAVQRAAGSGSYSFLTQVEMNRAVHLAAFK